MKPEQLVIRYLIGAKVPRLRALEAQSSPQIKLLINLSALLVSAVELALICDPIH